MQTISSGCALLRRDGIRRRRVRAWGVGVERDEFLWGDLDRPGGDGVALAGEVFDPFPEPGTPPGGAVTPQPLKVTYVWEENSVEQSDVRTVDVLPTTYTINCAATPVMKSIVVELAD